VIDENKIVQGLLRDGYLYEYIDFEDKRVKISIAIHPFYKQELVSGIEQEIQFNPGINGACILVPFERIK